MTSADGTHRRLTGRLTVALPPERAFVLFTPRGEQAWVPGWKPRFPAGTDDGRFDDTEPGTVFETEAHGQATTWIVVERALGRRIRYARVIPQLNAGTVAVALEPAAEGEGSEVTVTYELTALSEEGARKLDEFAAHYPAFLQSWEDQIAHSHTG
jgi:hypothetical protein